MSNIHQVVSVDVDSRWEYIQRLGGVAAFILAALLLVAIVLIAAGIQTGTIFHENFLVLIFKLHAGFNGVLEDSLDRLSLLDIAIMTLVSVVSLALYPILKRVNKVWSIVMVSLPIIGLLLFILTHGIGRSGIIAAGLIISILMLRSEIFRVRTAYLGILGNIALLVSDVGTAFTYSVIFAIILGIGYVLSTMWYILVGLRLIKPG